jgi:formate C-acetyltransferase
MFEGGARHNYVELEMIGITNASDSLYAIKKAVFDDNKVTLFELRDILRSNWQGYTEIHNYFRLLPKWGNDEPDVDEIRAKITTFLYKRFNDSPGPFGGIYVPGEVIFIAHEYCGAVTGATPDGRSAGEVLAGSAGASAGYEREGLTALMNSMLTLPVKDYLLTTVALNIRFLPDSFNDPHSRRGISLLIKSFFSQGGMQLQINVCDADTLRKAQEHPDEYKDLLVRVGGYSDYFVKLSRALQDEIINRVGF